jgi:glutamine synthetase
MVKVMVDEHVKKAIETLKSNNVRWVHSAFVDVRGILQDMVLPAREYLSGAAFTEGIGFDGSSVRGFQIHRRIRHDFYARCKNTLNHAMGNR